MAELTPMMRQYLEIKKDNPDSILFFRLGDFYEMFDEDARTASRELDLTLTSRDHGKHAKPAEERIPMCGIPYHASEAYIAPPDCQGLQGGPSVSRWRTPPLPRALSSGISSGVITPGTVTDAACLDDKSSNFLCGIYLDERSAAAAFCDVTTGKAHLTAFSGDERVEHIINEMGRFSPAEAILNDGAWAESRLLETLREKFHCRVERGGERRFLLADAEKSIPPPVWRGGVEAPARRESGGGHGHRRASQLPLRDPENGPQPHQRPGLLRTGRVFGAGPDRPPEPGADGDLAEQGEEGEPPLGAGQDQNPHGRAVLKELAGAAPALRHGHQPPFQRGCRRWWRPPSPGRS